MNVEDDLKLEIELKYDFKFPTKVSLFHRSVIQWYKKTKFLTKKQVAALKKPFKTYSSSNSYWDDNREDDSLFASAFDWGSQ